MTRSISARLCVPTLAVIAICLLGGCGSATKTVSVAASPPSTSAANTATGPTTPPTTSTTTSTGAGGTSPGTPSTTSTRTATAPAFTESKQEGTGAAGLPAALAVLRAHGYAAQATSEYHPAQTLRVLIGTGAHSNDGYDKQAFFFVDNHYIGTDASRPSAQISVVSQNDTEVTLAYQLYRPNDPLCCPGGGTAHVRFQLNNGHLTPLDPIPPTTSTTGTSRQ